MQAQDLEMNDEQTPEMDNQQTDWQAKVQELQQQLDEARSKYLYLYSDLETTRRNAARERLELMQTASREVMVTLLPILDDFERASKNGALSDGMALIHHKLVLALQQKGLQVLEIKAGDPFNADFQEAVAEIPAADDSKKGLIVDVMEPGYKLGERVLRFAKVVVGR